MSLSPASIGRVKPVLTGNLPVSNADFAQFLNHRGLQNQQGEVFYDDQDTDARIHRRNLVWQADLNYELQK